MVEQWKSQARVNLEAVKRQQEKALIGYYGDKPAKTAPGAGAAALSVLLAMEEEYCTPKDGDTSRLDPVKRVHFIANALQLTGALEPQHQHLLIMPELSE